MFTFSFGSAFATVSWTGEATSKTLNEAGDYDLNSKLVLDKTKTGDGAKGITEAYRAQLTADAKAELTHAKAEGIFYAPEKAAAVAAIEAYIEALKTVKTAKDAAKLKADLEGKVGTWENKTLTEKVENGVLVSLPTQATVRKLMTAAEKATIQIGTENVNVKADGIAKAKKTGGNAGEATFDLTRIAKRNADTTDASKVANSLYLPGCVELKTDQVKGTAVSGSTPTDYTFALQLDKSADTKASDIFVDTPTATGAKEIRDWFLDNGYREAADFDAGSRAFVAALVGVNSAYKNVAEGEAVAIQKEIDKYVVAAQNSRKGLSISEAEGIDALVKKINDFNDKYAGLDYAKNLLVDGEFKTAIWDSGLQKVSLAANYFDQYAAEVGAVPEVKKLTDADKATVVALYKKVNALEDSYAATWKYADKPKKVTLATVTDDYPDYKRLNAAYKHFLDADVKAFKALESFEEVTQGTGEGTTTKYFFDASEKNVGAVKAQRAAYDALVSNYGYADIHTNGITYTSAANSEARILAAEHNQGADAAYDVKDTKKLQAYLNNATLKVTTKALGNNKIRVNARFDAETYKDIVAECGNDYTISYKFYQKKAKATSFKGPKEKSRNYITYTKASLKKGTKYKFQCGVVIKDAQGNVVAEKNYRASTTGSRICR